MVPLNLSVENFARLGASGAESWPREACGLIFQGDGEDLKVVPMANLQDDLHQLDPSTHPRDATQAYAMDPLKVERFIDAEAEGGRALRGIYHSHPQHPAYFSAMDQRAAMPFGMPTFPEAWQVVMSVFEGEVVDVKAFYWSGGDQTWREGPIHGLPDLPGPPPGALPLDDT